MAQHTQATGLTRHYIEALVATLGANGYGETLQRFTIEELRGFPYTPETLAVIVREATDFLKDEFMGQTLRPCKLGARALIFELVTPCKTLREALIKSFQFYGLMVEDFVYQLREIDGQAEIEICFVEAGSDKNNLLREWLPILWHRFATWLIDEEINLSTVEFSHSPKAELAEYAQVFSCPCVFEQPKTVVRFDSSFLDKKIRRCSGDVKNYFNYNTIDFTRLPIAQLGLKADLKRSVGDFFEAEQKFPTIEQMAMQHFMCSQTLRRRLKAENTSYRQLKEEIRRERVVKYLAIGDISISEVSRMGGFAEPNGLTRAVKSWFGVCPKDYRSQIGLC